MLNIKSQRRKLKIQRQGPTLHHDSRQGQHDQEQRQKKNTDPDMSHKIKDKGKEARVQGFKGPRAQGEKIILDWRLEILFIGPGSHPAPGLWPASPC